MNRAVIEKIADAVLYEGYMLYPYRASSIKNRQRFNFGVLYPEGYDTSLQRTECLVEDKGGAVVDMAIRYLRINSTGQADEKTIELREVGLSGIVDSPRIECADIARVQISATPLGVGLWRLRIEICNRMMASGGLTRDSALCASMISVHTILSVRGGSFPSMTDPPAGLGETARECRNVGTWPVLVGAEGSHDAMLSSPIILYDYPQIAPESPQDLFDGTEIDEILTLRVLTLTEDEKAEIRGGDERARALIEVAENIPPEQFLKLHGALRAIPGPTTLRKGDRVRLWPRRSADIMDIALKGRIAIIEAVEEDFEGNIHFAVVIDDDPGRDLGELRQPGHRFFFGAEEVEPLGPEEPAERICL